MESTAQANISMNLKGELDSVSKELNDAIRESLHGDSSASSRVIDLQAQITSIRELIKNADQASAIAENKETEEKNKIEEQEIKKQIQEKLAQESSKSSNSDGLKFLDDHDDETTKASLASLQASGSALASAQVSGKTNSANDHDDQANSKPVSSSGQAST